jgi:hypothetical protein
MMLRLLKNGADAGLPATRDIVRLRGELVVRASTAPPTKY